MEPFVGRSEAHFVAETERYLGVRLQADWDENYQHSYRAAFERDLVPVDGIGEALAGLRLPQCVASSGTHAKMQRTLGVEPAGCAVVEDSVYGVQAARAAGMHVFAYGVGVTPASRLAGPGTTVFGHMKELPDLIAAGRP